MRYYFRNFVKWLYTRYVLMPEIREKYGPDAILVGEEDCIELVFEPSEELKAQVMKDVIGPSVH